MRHSLPIISRVLAAITGGYAVTSLLTLALTLMLAALGVNQAQALLAATTGSFLVWAAIIMAVFHARSALRAWLWLAGAFALFALATCLLWQGA
jgi:hypothetical protein